MKKRYYRFAGITIEIAMPEEMFPDKESKLKAFRGNSSEDAHTFCYQKVPEIPPPEGTLEAESASFFAIKCGETAVRYLGYSYKDWEKAFIRAEHRGKEHRISVREDLFPGKISEKNILESLAAEHLIARNNGFVFHCSYVDYNGKAILFTAPSETGKSTQAELWKNLRGAEIINGDRAAVRLVDGVLMAEGIPFAGSSQYCENRSLPIAAIVYLGQAPETSIRKMWGYEAFSKILEGASVNIWDKEDMEQVSGVVQKVAEQVPVYFLRCTPDESAVNTLEEALRKQVSL